VIASLVPVTACHRPATRAERTTRAELIGVWVKSGTAMDGRDWDLELHLNLDKTGLLVKHPAPKSKGQSERAELEWWAEERDNRPVLILRGCATLANGAEIAIPFERVRNALQLTPAAGSEGLLAALAGDWVIGKGRAAEPRGAPDSGRDAR
jgi:hypothetical protein